MTKLLPQDVGLFEPLESGEFDGRYYDLHNDYVCRKVELSKAGHLRLMLVGYPGPLEFTLFDASIVKLDIIIHPEEDWIIDTLYRGEAMVDGVMSERNQEGLYLFFVSFVNECEICSWSSGFSLAQAVEG